MRDMAQLRLQAEVKELEGSVSSASTPAFPPYVVPDTSALVEAHGLIRQLAHSARFIIIIPLAGTFTYLFIRKHGLLESASSELKLPTPT